MTIWTERPSCNFRNRKSDGSHSQVSGRRPDCVCMLKEMTVISRETMREILVDDLKKRRKCLLVSLLIFANARTKTSTLCIVCWIYWNDWWRKKCFKRILMGDENWCFVEVQKPNIRVQLGWVQRNRQLRKWECKKSRVKTMLTAFSDAGGMCPEDADYKRKHL
jgi:hypothetical protein